MWHRDIPGEILMRRITRVFRFTLAAGVLLGAGLFAMTSLSGATSATATLTVTPDTGFTLGSVAVVTGSGFAADETGFLLECNDDPNQPTITALGNTFPVGCSDPLIHVVTTSAAGTLGPLDFTVVDGVVGPPATGPDSNGNPTSTDTVLYPCPPTAAQLVAGDSCDIQFGDVGVDLAGQDISFGGPAPTTTTTTTSTTTTTTTTTTTPATTTTPTTATQVGVTIGTTPATQTAVVTQTNVTSAAPAAASLAFTGPGRGVWATAIGGFFLLDLGLLVMLLYFRPRELLRMTGRGIAQVFGGH
jgi:hypothetical protein